MLLSVKKMLPRRHREIWRRNPHQLKKLRIGYHLPKCKYTCLVYIFLNQKSSYCNERFLWVVTNLYLYFLFKFLYIFRMASSLSIIYWDRLCFFAEKDSNWREHKNLTKIMPKMQNLIIQPDQLMRVNWIVLARKRSVKCNSYSDKTDQRALNDW